MGNERKGKTRLTFFVSDNLAIQLKENAYQERKTLTAYFQDIMLEKIKMERENELKKNMCGMQERIYLR